MGILYNIYCTVFNITTFNPISELGGEIADTGGHIKTPDRFKAALVSMNRNDLITYLYNTNKNNFIKIDIVTSSRCDCEVIDINVEYFPEREEFVYYYVRRYEIYSAKLSNNEI